MSQVGTQHVWASQDDWEVHRELISRLYWDECRPLPEVMEIMRSEHNFHATPRMYKFRFKKWGLTKNLKNDQDEEIRVQAANGGIPAVPLIRGRVPGSKKLKRYVHRLAPNYLPESAIQPSRVRSPICRDRSRVGRDDRRSTTPSSIYVATTPTRGFYSPPPPPLSQQQQQQQQLPQPLLSPPSSSSSSSSPMPVYLSAPDSLRLSQQSLRAVLEYTNNRMHKGAWDATGVLYDSEDPSDNWHNTVFQASAMIQRGKFREGFRLLDICYKNYTAQLDAAHPLLIIETYTSVLNLARIEHALAHSLVRYIAGLCRIRLGPAHPLARFWAGLLAMGLPQVRQAVGAVVRAQFDLFEAYFAPGAEFLITQNVDAARTLHESGCIPLSSAEAIIARAIQQRRSSRARGASGNPNSTATTTTTAPARPRRRPGADDFVCWARLVLGLLYVRDGRCDLAAPVIEEVGAQIRARERRPPRPPRSPRPPDQGEEEDDEGIISVFTQNEYRTMRVHLLRGSGAPVEELAACLRERFDFCLGAVGPGHHWTTRAFAELDELYRAEAGDVAAAERLRADFDFAVQWDEVCKREEERVEALAAAAGGHGGRDAGVGGGRVEEEVVEVEVVEVEEAARPASTATISDGDT